MSAALLGGVLVIVGLATAWNLQGWPGRVDDDEGTYVAQAWAVLYEHTLTHYSYWYDHPPLGWIQIAIFAWVTDGFNRVASAVFVGREFMWCVTIACCVLLWALCRRLGMRRTTSAVTVLIFGLSPIAQYFHRLVSLDNIEAMWVLAALVAAASPRSSSARGGWRPACLSGACAAIAILSKETAVILLPVIVWVLLQRTGDSPAGAAGAGEAGGPGTVAGAGPGAVAGAGPGAVAGGRARGRHARPGVGPSSLADLPVWKPDWSAFASRHALPSNPAGVLRRAAAAARRLPAWGQRLGVFAVMVVVIVAAYPVYALQRGQLPLLWSTLTYQFFRRPGSGSLLNTSSGTYASVHEWVTNDPWVLLVAPVLALFLLASRRFRPFAFALLLQIAVLLKGGYLPFFYLSAVLPFSALMLGGTADALWSTISAERLSSWSARLGGFGGVVRTRAWRFAPYLGRAVVAVAALFYTVHVLPDWVSDLNEHSSYNGAAPYLAAAAWAERSVPKGDVVVVDDYLWVDLKRHGLSPLWLWKIDPQTDPDGWKSISYVILQPQSAGTLSAIPALRDAYAHSVLVANFGHGLTARRVVGG